MNAHTAYALIAVLITLGGLSATDAFAAGHGDEDEHAHENGEHMEEKDGEAMMEEKDDAMMMMDDEKMMMMEEMMAMMMEKPFAIVTSSAEYTSGDEIKVYGHVQTQIVGNAVTLTVQSPLGGSIIEARQITPNEDGTFSTTIKTTGAAWKTEGDYVINAKYSKDTSSVTIHVTVPAMMEPSEGPCGDGEIALNEEWCIPYTISGGAVTGVTANLEERASSLVFTIEARGDGEFTISPSEDVMSGPLIVLVDGEESDDAVIDGNTVTVPITAETQLVEVFATFVVPEFGTIAAVILAVAIVSIIAVSARSRLSITPKY